LTTVKADSVDLGYQAVRDVVQLIHNPNEEIHSKVDSTLLCRESCGCRGFEVQDIMQYTQIDIMKETSPQRIATAINAYFFQQYHSTEAIEDCKKSVEEFVELLMAHCEKGVDQYAHEKIVNSFAELVNTKLQNFISNDMIFNGMDVLFQKMFYLVDDEEKRFHVCQLMNDLYKRLMNENFANLKRQESGVKDLNHHINRITQDMLMFEHDDDAAYGMAVDKLNQLELASSYLFIFEEPIIHHKMDEWTRPDKAMLKAYNIGDEVYELSGEQQVTDVETLFRNPHLPEDHRYTMVFAPLYSGVEQYGLLLCELDESYFYFVTAITSQLFSAIKIIRLLREKEETKRQLQVSLEQIKENNLILDEVAKSDELTKIYNRRGFLATAKSLIKKKENQGLRALVMYADMDNLKIVNDRFGHEDGDFSLRFIADILKEAVRSQDIVARMGGDEFAALVIVGNQENMAVQIRKRIDELIMTKNAQTDKEYFVNMSVGFHEFVCDADADIMELLDKADKNLYIEKKNKVKKIYKKDVYQ
jgi:diguanylate cyclase (GGDEF)-like protein